MKPSRIIPVVAGAAAALLLAACSPLPGTAAILNGERVAETTIDDAMAGCATALGISEDQLVRAGVVRTYALASVFDSVAAEFGELGDDEIDQLGRQQGGEQAAMIDNEQCRPLARRSIKASMLTQLDQNAIMGILQEADIELNPRYGTWDPSGAELFTSSSISVPVTPTQP